MRCKTTDTEIEAAKAVATQIRAGLEALTVAEQTMRLAGERFERLALANLADFNNLKPDDDVMIDHYAAQKARFTVLREWIVTAEPLRSAVLNLQRTLWAAKESIETCAQARSVEEGALAACDWTELLRRVPDIDLPNQIQTVRSIGNQVVRDLEQLLSRRVGMALSAEEIRECVLRVAGLGVVRRLTQSEMVSGYAVE